MKEQKINRDIQAVRMTGGEALLNALEDHGVKTFFGYPGGAIMPVYDKLYDHKDTLNHILMRHEQGAIHAAQGFARVSGQLGVCMVTSGPGATNTVTGIADAMIDSTPVLVIAGQVGTKMLGSDAFQEVDLVGITQPISKWSYQIRSAEDVPWAVARACYIATSGRPGPVVLDFTKDAQIGFVDYQPTIVDFIRSYVSNPQPKEGALESAAKLINAAARPLVLVGQGVLLGEATSELEQFIQKTDIPVGTTLLGLSALPSNHPNNLGMLGMHGNLAPNKATNLCDVLIAVGMRFDDRVTGNLQTYAPQAKVIHLDIDSAEFNKNVRVTIPILGDCKQSLKRLTELAEKRNHQAWKDSLIPYAEEEYKVVCAKEMSTTSDGYLRMGQVARLVSEAAHNEAILVTDVGQNQMLSARYFKYTQPRSLVTSGGLGTMGFGLPAAIGAVYGNRQLNHDDKKPVVLMTGDGGIQMVIQELGTIMEQQCPVKMVILNNSYLGNVRQWQEMFFGKRYSFTPMKNPDYLKLSDAYGIKSKRVITEDQLNEAISEMLAYEGAYLLEVCVEKEGNVMPMVPIGGTISEMLLEP
ncbi:MAG: biosynthetic-type acetolactate synthase large subunit [Bacteroidaceae bacterium]